MKILPKTIKEAARRQREIRLNQPRITDAEAQRQFDRVAAGKDYPDETPGTALAREVRAKCNKLTAEERAKFMALAMDVINP